MLERSEHRVLRAGCAAILAALLGGCGFPDFTYDLPEDASAGSGGSAGSAGSSGADAADVSPETATGGSGGSLPEASDGAEVSLDAVQEDGPAPDGADGGDVQEPDVLDSADALDAISEEAEPPDTGAEDCTNGQDDDNDGKIDCQDSDCSVLFKCVSPAPTGWNGWYQLYEGPQSGVPSCDPPFSSLALAAGRDPVQTPATCSSCNCGTPANAECDDAELVIWENATCNSQTGWSNFTYTPYGACKGWNLNGPDGGTATPMAASWVMPPLHKAGTGSCTASGGIVNLPTPAWTTVAAACEADLVGGGCPGQSVCAPKPSSAFKPGVCVYKAGDTACPVGPYSSKFVFYQAFADGRGCSSCSCGNPTGVTCNATMTIATNNSCSGGAVEATFSDLDCHAIQTNTLQYLQYTPQPATGGSCQADGGDPIGTLTNDTSSAYTFCCVPF